LEELGKEAAAAGEAYNEAVGAYRKFNEETGRSQTAINESIFSLSALSEKLKTLRDDLNNADPSSIEFGRLIVDIAALEAGIARVQDRAKDPIELLIKTPARLKERTAELNKLFEDQLRIQEELASATALDPDGTSPGVKQLNADLDEIQKKDS
jgi:hypothetical protein